MQIDMTPRGWSGYDRGQIAAVIAYLLEKWPIAEVSASRQKLIVDVDRKPPISPEEVEEARRAVAELGPWMSQDPNTPECSCDVFKTSRGTERIQAEDCPQHLKLDTEMEGR